MPIKDIQKRREHNRINKAKSRLNKPDSKFLKAHFIVWDGEGLEIKEGQVYGTLSCKTYDGKYYDLYNIHGLTTYDCFQFMSDIAEKYKDATHIIFSGQYDITMIFKYGLSKAKIKECYIKRSSENTYYDKFCFSYTPKKQFRLNQAVIGDDKKWVKDKKGKTVYKSQFNLWDVFGFFACSLEQAIRDWLGDDYEPLTMIINGKRTRGAFHPKDLPNVLAYCHAELDALLLIMQKLHAAIVRSGITLKRWDGAGAVAAALMEKYGVKKHISTQPEKVREAARYAFAGGRIECLKIGKYDDTVYGHDINSAYPTALLELPSLGEGMGEWHHYTYTKDVLQNTYRLDPYFSMYLIEWNFPDNRPFYPFFFRDEDGTIYYPPKGKNWIWKPELDAAWDIPENRKYITIKEALQYHPHRNVKPFSFIQEIYDLRAELKANKDRAEYIFKLGMNSVYGKLAQRIATMNRDGTYNKPPYHQLEYAGYITSYTRALVYQTAMQKPDSIIMFATDGIYSTEELEVTTSKTKKLGEWTKEKYNSAIFVKSGIYWLDDSMKISTKFRGFDKGTIQLYDYCNIETREHMPGILDEWRRAKSLGSGPRITVPLTRFISAGRALAGDNSWAKYGTWDKQKRILKLIPMLGEKRYVPTSAWNDNPCDGFIQTVAGMHDGNHKTMSSAKAILWDMDIFNEAEYNDDLPQEFA